MSWFIQLIVLAEKTEHYIIINVYSLAKLHSKEYLGWWCKSIGLNRHRKAAECGNSQSEDWDHTKSSNGPRGPNMKQRLQPCARTHTHKMPYPSFQPRGHNLHKKFSVNAVIILTLPLNMSLVLDDTNCRLFCTMTTSNHSNVHSIV